MREFYNTLTPYKSVDYKGIQYSVCRDFSHISRYKGLRQVVHLPEDASDRFITLEVPNEITTNVPVIYYTVPSTEENRLDVIANKHLGSPTYSWIIAYFNHISDGFSVPQGQVLKIPKSLYSLFESGQILSSISPLSLNLGTE